MFLNFKLSWILKDLKEEIDSRDWAITNESEALCQFYFNSTKDRKEGKDNWDFDKENELLTRVILKALDRLADEEKVDG